MTLPATATIVHDEVIPANSPWTGRIAKGQKFRIEDTCGCQSVDTLFYNAHDMDERYSSQDTLREQGSAYLSTGTRIMSNRGNLMLSIVADSCGLHDTSAGACSCEANTVRFGHATKYMHSCRENFIIGLARYGRSKRDIVPNINFFMNVPIEPSGIMTVVDGVSGPGAYVELIAAMDVICVISNCPQVNNPCNCFDPTPSRVIISQPE